MQDKTIIITIFAICVCLVAAMAGFIAWILFAYQKKQTAFQTQLEAIRNNYEKELLKTQLEIQEQTFQYISREIHDNVGQFISLAKLNLNMLNLNNKESIRLQVYNSTELLTRALDDLRDLSKSFSSDMIRDAGLIKAIEMQVSQLQKTESYDIVFEVRGNYDYMQDERELILFRIIQEAINNIIRHANAKQIIIILSCSEESLEIYIHDNGKGFDTSHISNHGGGIRNMKKRANLIHAGFKMESSPQKGTSIFINSPTKELQNEN
jgi:two-component system, NarL family, sensor kinase